MDDRRFNFRRNPSLQHKIRVIMGSKEDPRQWGVTIPKPIAKQFVNCELIISVSGNSIILESGCKPYAVEVRENLNGDFLAIENGEDTLAQ